MSTAPLIVGTFNVGDATDDEIRDVVNMADVIALQEFSDRDDVANDLIRADVGLIRPTAAVGQAATPLAYNRTVMRLRDVVAVPLHPGGPIGPGTGPDTMKPKWLIGGRFTHVPSGRTLVVCSTHLPPGQGHDRRSDVAQAMLTTAYDALARYRCVRIIGMDANTTPTSDTVDPLRKHGWTCDHNEGRRIPTHGADWSPDHVWWTRDDRIAYDRHRTVKTRSDHRANLSHFDLTTRATTPRG